MNEILKIVRTGRSVELTLNRSERRNALSRALIAQLSDALVDVERDDNVRSVTITGAPPAFCAGLDLRELAETTREEEAEVDASNLSALFETIDNLSKPVIAAVNGPAVAGGAGLVSVCDIAICARSAVIGYPEIRRGLVAAIVMTYLRRIVPERQAKHLLLTGENVDAHRAMELGLVNEVVPDEELLARARHYSTLFASYPPQAVADTKRLLNKACKLHHTDAVAEARRLNASMRLTRESREGIGSFLRGS